MLEMDFQDYWTLAGVAVVVFLTLLVANWKWVYIIYQTYPRDIIAGIRFLKLNVILYLWARKQQTVAKLFSKRANDHPEKVAFYYEDEKWTFRQLEDFSNRIANYFKSCGFQKGDTVALLMENRPEHVGIWLGLSKIGVATALLNTNLVSDSLFHSISVAKSKTIIYGQEYAAAIVGIADKIKNLKVFHYGTKETMSSRVASIDLKTELESHSNESPTSDIENTMPKDNIMYIYTSGTTGLPKAAIITNARLMFVTAGIHTMVNIKDDDIYYNPLPMYHSAGGMVGVGQTVLFGVSVVLRKKFSASSYWSDCQRYNCTIANYIGEMCRYLLSAHKSGTYVDHQVTKIVGNGMRPRIWEQFTETFNISQVFEFYGATEGNANLINIDNKVGAVGFVPRYASFLYPITLIRCNEDTGEPIKNKKGFCISCKPGEGGILIGQINNRIVTCEFAGYADEDATKKKILENVFRKGDIYFNTGDILVQDELGYYYFKDRTGDTYRWKGENVATTEVETVISNLTNLRDSVVYGVEVPGTEGRVGMAAVVDPDNTLDKEELGRQLREHLPRYAIPLFLRIVDSVSLTGTFKMKKVELQKEGFDVNKIKDRLYFFDSIKSYIPLTHQIYNDIISGKLKL